MDDDRVPKNVLDAELFGSQFHICFASVCKQGRKIACVVWVRTMVQIKMRAGFGKIVSGAARSLVDMKGKDSAIISVCRQPMYLDGNNHSAAK